MENATLYSNLNSKIEKYQGTRIWISGVNCDNYTNEGLYMLSDSLTNAPLTWFMLIVFAPRNDAITQIAIKSPSLIYVRNYTSIWSSWEKVSLKSDIKQDNFTGTTSANGNTSKQFSSKVIILSAWSSHDSYIVKQYPGAGADAAGQYTWWFHVCSDNANMTPVAGESVAIYYTYIEK